MNDRYHREIDSHPPDPNPVTDPAVVTRLIGVYDAEGTLRGELSYWVRARFGRAHCALCDITHGTFKERPEWQRCREGLGVEFDTFHLDDQPASVREASGGDAPVVVAETSVGITVLLGPAALERCEGSTDALITAVEDAMEQVGLRWP